MSSHRTLFQSSDHFKAKCKSQEVLYSHLTGVPRNPGWGPGVPKAEYSSSVLLITGLSLMGDEGALDRGPGCAIAARMHVRRKGGPLDT